MSLYSSLVADWFHLPGFKEIMPPQKQMPSIIKELQPAMRGGGD